MLTSKNAAASHGPNFRIGDEIGEERRMLVAEPRRQQHLERLADQRVPRIAEQAQRLGVDVPDRE